jgi:hypothetical protein
MVYRTLRVVSLALLLLGVLLLAPRPGHAIVIKFEAEDLLEINPAQDLWQYRYRVSGFTFDKNFGFSILFDPALYSDLEDPPPPVNADWDAAVLQPDPALPDDGLYDAVAMVDGASLADLFRVNFVWLGGRGTTPGSQPFTVNQFDDQGGCVACPVLEGRTVPAEGTAVIPEPGTLWLIGTRLAALGLLRKRTTQNPLSHEGRGLSWKGERKTQAAC